jgi:uncharacterized protein with ParB-like and HNH nuclease domain
MTTLNAIIQPSRPTVGTIVANMRSKSYFVDNSFQRRLVWTERQKVRLIETVLLGFPMPEIYLWQQDVDADSGLDRQSIVDGQQRLTALLQFASNEWPLKATYLEKKDEFYADLQWKDFKPDQKKIVWNYVINARTIPSNVTEEEIRRVFVRLNETDKSLNPQELRHAEFSGKFLEAAEEVADLPVWRKWAIFSDSQIRRMADIEMASTLLIYLRSGITSDTPQNINRIYDLYNDVYKEKSEDILSVKRFIWAATRFYLKVDGVRDLFTQPVHLYSLFVADDVLRREKIARSKIGSKLATFARAYHRDSENKIIARYREASSYRTRSKSSRQVRVNALLDWIRE